MTPASPPEKRQLDALWQAVLSLKDAGECRRFFTDLCTPAELRSMADRWLTARLVDRGLSYRKIYEDTGVSTATVTRVARCVGSGAGGYRVVLDRLAKTRRQANA